MLTKTLIFLGVIFYASASELNIYRNVAEIREEQSGTYCLLYDFNSGLYPNIIDGSISWDGTQFVKQEIYDSMDSLKDTVVRVRNPFACDCQMIEAKIVNPVTMLVEGVESGKRFYVDSRSVEYPSDMPHNGDMTLDLKFENEETEFSGMLSYLMRGLSWMATYDLVFMDDNKCSAMAYANIRNGQEKEYSVDKINLYSSDLPLVASNSFRMTGPTVYSTAMKGSTESDDGSTRQIESAGESRGIYLYSLQESYTLRPGSMTRLPFLNISPKCSFDYKATTNINTGNKKGVFQRQYTFIPDKFVPAGIVTIRDNNVIIGQTNLPDTPGDVEQILRLGDDNDVRYSVKGTMMKSSADKEKPMWKTYELEIIIANYKEKSVRGQLLFYGATRTLIDTTTCGSAKVDAGMIQIPFSLREINKIICTMQVTLTWG